MDFGTVAFSFSDGRDDGGGTTSVSVSETEEMARAVCDAIQRRRVAFDGNTWIGYGDPRLKIIELIDRLLQDCCG